MSAADEGVTSANDPRLPSRPLISGSVSGIVAVAPRTTSTALHAVSDAATVSAPGAVPRGSGTGLRCAARGVPAVSAGVQLRTVAKQLQVSSDSGAGGRDVSRIPSFTESGAIVNIPDESIPRGLNEKARKPI
jgi:hypothetical protein